MTFAYIHLDAGIVEAATWMGEVCWSVCLCAALSRGPSFLAVAIMRKGRKEEMDKETDESVRPNFAKPGLAWQEKAQKEGEDAALGQYEQNEAGCCFPLKRRSCWISKALSSCPSDKIASHQASPKEISMILIMWSVGR